MPGTNSHDTDNTGFARKLFILYVILACSCKTKGPILSNIRKLCRLCASARASGAY